MQPRLILLVDFSDHSGRLVEFAGTWAPKTGATILLVHQLTGTMPVLADSDTRFRLMEQEKGEPLAGLYELAKTHLPASVTYSCRVTDGGLITFLQHELRQFSPDLVILGLKTSGLIKQLMIGSTAARVMEELNTPTLAVPYSIGNQAPEKLVVALHYKYALNQKAFDNFLAAFGSPIKKVEFITIVTPADNDAEANAYLSNITSHYSALLPSTFRLFTGNDAFTSLAAYMQPQTNSMLVVQKGARSITDYMFRRFLLHELVHAGSLPLIVMPL